MNRHRPRTLALIVRKVANTFGNILWSVSQPDSTLVIVLDVVSSAQRLVWHGQSFDHGPKTLASQTTGLQMRCCGYESNSSIEQNANVLKIPKFMAYIEFCLDPYLSSLETQAVPLFSSCFVPWSSSYILAWKRFLRTTIAIVPLFVYCCVALVNKSKKNAYSVLFKYKQQHKSKLLVEFLKKGRNRKAWHKVSQSQIASEAGTSNQILLSAANEEMSQRTKSDCIQNQMELKCTVWYYKHYTLYNVKPFSKSL